MGYASRSGHAVTNPHAPRAFGVCDRCGRWWNLFKLTYQYEWQGTKLINTRKRVCLECKDLANPQMKARLAPPDPVPVYDPRPENFIPSRFDPTPVSGNPIEQEGAASAAAVSSDPDRARGADNDRMNKPFPPPITPDPTLPSSPIPGVPGPAAWLPGQTAQNETPISLLPPASALMGGEQIPMVQGGVTVRAPSSALLAQGPLGPAGSSGSTVVSATPPSGPSIGSLWFDTLGGQTYLWYDDGTSQQWVSIVNQTGVQ